MMAKEGKIKDLLDWCEEEFDAKIRTISLYFSNYLLTFLPSQSDPPPLLLFFF
eukprot:COSAG02_NODE_933_length_15812_cov_68.551709_9_plen_53_part_00